MRPLLGTLRRQGLCSHFSFCPLVAPSRDGRGYEANACSFGHLQKAKELKPILGFCPLVAPPPPPPRREEICSHSALFGVPRECKSDVANFVRCWGPPRRQGLCSDSALFWAPCEANSEVATSDFLPLLGTSQEAGVR